MATAQLDLLRGKKCYAFDLDGTLVDSNKSHEDAFVEAISKYIPEALPGFSYERFKGQRTVDVFRALEVKDEQLLELLTQTKQTTYRQVVATGSVALFPFVADLLTALSERKHRLCLVTGASRHSAEAILRHHALTDFFEFLITGDDVSTTKPSPECYLAGVSRLAVDSSTIVAVEDATAGLEAARLAGLDVIAVNNSALIHHQHYYRSIEELHTALFGGETTCLSAQ